MEIDSPQMGHGWQDSTTSEQLTQNITTWTPSQLDCNGGTQYSTSVSLLWFPSLSGMPPWS